MFFRKFINYEKYIFQKILKLFSKILKYIFLIFYFEKIFKLFSKFNTDFFFRKRSFLNFLNKKNL